MSMAREILGELAGQAWNQRSNNNGGGR